MLVPIAILTVDVHVIQTLDQASVNYSVITVLLVWPQIWALVSFCF